MKQISSNINIIGGGLIGSITAFSLSKLGLEISILEKNQLIPKKTKLMREPPQYLKVLKIFLIV